MSVDPNQMIGAAIRAMQNGTVPSEMAELQFDLDAAIASSDLQAVFRLIPRLTTVSESEISAIKARLQQEFKRDFRVTDFTRSLREERQKSRRAAIRIRTNLPSIETNNRPLRDISTESLSAVRQANDPPVLFVRSGELVHISVDEHDRPSITRATPAHIRGRLDRAANFMKTGADTERHIPPPKEVVEDIMALPSEQWPLPPLGAVVEVPTLRPDGTVLTEPGYDPASWLYYAPADGLQVPEIPDDPMSDDVEAAIDLINEAIGEFPYVDKASRANLFGLLLTPIVRPAIRGCTPLALIDAPKAGTGKSLLVDVFSVISTGRPSAMTPYPRTDEEMQKQIGAFLIAGRPVVCFDNLEGVLQSPALALLLTAKEYAARILGVTENMIVPNNATWVVTGNNIRPSGDMPRRCYWIRLDARTSEPFRGRKFKHANLLEWVLDNRGRLLHALLTMARSWYVTGAKVTVTDPLGSFDSWHCIVGSILAHCGVEGFLGNLDKFLKEADDTANQWESFLLVLADHFRRGEEFTVATMLERITGSPSLKAALPDTISDALVGKGDAKKSIGIAFSKRRETRYGDTGAYLRRRVNTDTKTSQWSVIVPGLEGNDVPENSLGETEDATVS